MRKIIYAMPVSLDGFMEAAGGDLSWSFPDPELHQHFNEQEALIDTHIYGRGLYENMASFWPTADENASAPQVEIEYARIWKSMEKVVFSKTLEKVDWNSRLVRGEIASEIKRLKTQPGKDISVGGAGLASSFMRLDLIDEYRLYIHPVILGSGKRMFQPPLERLNLQLVETYPFSSGVVLLKYQRV